jgi:hypothetical protein
MDYPGQNPAALRTVALNQLKWSGRLVATGGPLTYGLVPLNDQWFWCLWVGSENYQRVRLDAALIVRQADQAGLSDRWQRSVRPTAALALETRLADHATYEAATAWFSDGLDELYSKQILSGFLDGLSAKLGTVFTRP